MLGIFKRKDCQHQVKGISIRSSLLRNFSLMIVLVLVSFTTAFLIIQYSELSVVSRRLIREAMVELERELQKDFQPVIKNINISAYWGKSRQYTDLEDKEMLKMFIPIIKEYSSIVRVKSGDDNGNGFSLQREGDNWITTRTVVDKSQSVVLISSWNEDLELKTKERKKAQSNLKLQEWYRVAIEGAPDKLGWSVPYFWEETQELAVTVSIKVEGRAGEVYVLAFDILLTQLQDIMQDTVISDNGIVFVTTNDDRLVGLSGNILDRSDMNIKDLSLKSVYETSLDPIKDLIDDWYSKKRKRFSKIVHFASNNQRWVGTIVEFPEKGVPIIKIGMLAPMSDVMHYDAARGMSVIFVLIVALLIAVFVSKKMARRYILPVQQILEQSEKISKGDLKKGKRITCNIKELSQLADTHEVMRQALEESRHQLEDYSNTLSQKVEERTSELNRKSEELAELNRTLEERVKKEVQENLKKDQLMLRSARQAQMGEMLSMIAHQWRQPLSSISTITGNLMVYLELDDYNRDQFLELLGNINDHAQFLSRTINDFRNFFNPNKRKESVRLNEILEQTINIIGRSLEYKSINLKRDYSFLSPIITYPNEITQVILNILKNAQDVLVERKLSEPQINIRGYQKDQTQIIEIHDNAGGIPNEDFDKIFDPYFSTKDEKTGTGLGLYMSKLIIEKHCKGRLTAENRDDGACFIISMPMLSEEEI